MNHCVWKKSETHFDCERCDQPRVKRSVIDGDKYFRTCVVPPKPRGFGDTIARWLKSLGFKQRKGCGCGRRQRRLNSLIPYDKTAWKWRLLWPFLWIRRR